MNQNHMPSGAALECPKCGETMHRILRGKPTGRKGKTLECVVRCLECGMIRKATMKREKPIQVKVIVSKDERSTTKELRLLPEEKVILGDKLVIDDLDVEVSSIESGGRRVDAAKAREIDVLWTKRADRVKVRFSVNKGPRTVSKELMAQPDEEFYVGDMIELGRMKVVIHRIKCKGRVVREGGAPASSIVRIYAKSIKERWG